MGQLAHFDDRHSYKLESSSLGIIQTALVDAVTPLSTTIDALMARIALCERGQGASEKVMAVKAAIDVLRSDVDQLKSTDMSMIFRMVEIPDVPYMPPATTGDEVRFEEKVDPESEAETDGDILEASLVDTPLADPSATTVPSEVTPSTVTQVQIDAPGTDAQRDGATV
ncbi:hypothetical protein H5410_032012 [Solanum commersonii]|uniref:Polyprotein protein n=1 Tax=Solanum commersonii TaxID=4109 RepID=A0A9J5YJU6_SOLCO|nr:hypothetical protein H5410_032012 [Solanum commersonii]